MIERSFESTEKSNIEALIANAVPEGRTIDYKQAMPEGNDAAKKEFLADITSFANAGGGDLLFGVREKRDGQGKTTGIPEAAGPAFDDPHDHLGNFI